MIDMTRADVLAHPFEALERWLALPGARHIVIESKDRSALLMQMPNPNLMVRLVDETGTVAQGMVNRELEPLDPARYGTALAQVVGMTVCVAANLPADDGPCFDGGCDR